jgi:hypothetical protein
MKLAMELIPAPCWGQTLQGQIGAEWWRALEEQTLRDARGRCAVCGALATLQLDERWDYDDAQSIRTLNAVEALCALCFFGRHYGLATVLSAQGKVDLAAVEEHFRRLNGEARQPMSEAEFQLHRDAARRRWVARNLLAWRTDFGRYHPPAP